MLLVPQKSLVNSRSEIDLNTIISQKLKLKIPLIATNMDTVSGVEMAIELGKLGGIALLPRWERPEIQANKVDEVVKAGQKAAACIGIKEGEIQRAEMLVNAGATFINIDVAHGHLEKNLEMTRKIKQKFGDQITLMGGIAATGDCANDLYNAGADTVYVGVGGGSICITRTQTGCGIPTLASLLDIAPVARKHNKTFIPCAGIKNSGDIVKALAAGASAIGAGSLFAGTVETPGNVIEIEGKKYKQYNGSASKAEKVKQVEIDSSDKGEEYTKHVEGVEAKVPYKGPVRDMVEDLCAGIRSGMSYCNAFNIEELWEKAQFVQITTAGNRESKAHDVLTNF